MKWGPVLGVSLLFHAVFFCMLIYFPESVSFQRPTGMFNVVQVELVSPGAVAPPSKEKGTTQTPPPSSQSKSTKSITVPEKKTARLLAPVKTEKKPVVVAKRTVKKKTTPVKKKEVSASELIDQAIKKIDRKVRAEEKKTSPKPTAKGSHLDRALAGVEARARAEAGSGEGTAGMGGATGTLMQIYYANVHNWISSNWSYPVALKSDPDLEAVVLLEVQRDGKILSTRFIARSSEPVFDESVLRAIERSDPLPPFPEVYRRSHDEFQIRFNLKELEQS
jgi:colicin import membrane protein